MVFHAAEPLYAVGTGQHVERDIAAGALPEGAHGHRRLPEQEGVATQVQFLLGKPAVAQPVGKDKMVPVGVEPVPGPVAVVARVVGEPVADAGPPLVVGSGFCERPAVLAEGDVCIFQAEGGTVLETSPCVGQAQVGECSVLGPDGGAVEDAPVVYVGIVADAVVVAYPVVVGEGGLAGDSVVGQVVARHDKDFELLLCRAHGDKVYGGRPPALVIRFEEQEQHGPVFQPSLFGESQDGECRETLEIVRFGLGGGRICRLCPEHAGANPEDEERDESVCFF